MSWINYAIVTSTKEVITKHEKFSATQRYMGMIERIGCLIVNVAVDLTMLLHEL